MKKVLSLLLAAMILLGSASAMESGKVVIKGTEKRNISVHATGDNTVEAGVSPTTGENLAELAATLNLPATYGGMVKSGKYYPVLVQISNPNGGIGQNAPWFASYCDVMYETMLSGDGITRHTAVFNNVLPEIVGPLRSIRTHHLAIQAEWNCPYFFHGKQDMYVDPLMIELNKARPGTTYSRKLNTVGILYNGTDGNSKPYKSGDRHFRVNKTQIDAPNNAGYKLAEIVKEVSPADWEFASHAYVFTDNLPLGGDDASFIYVNWQQAVNNSRLEYNPEDNVYERYVYLPDNSNRSALYDELTLTNPQLVNRDKSGQGTFTFEIEHGNPITFTNVIVQYVTIDWDGQGTKFFPAGKKDGSGNADYFMGGKHYQGVWKRGSIFDRTVFYGPDGYEMPLLRGKTLIIMMDTKQNRSVSYDP